MTGNLILEDGGPGQPGPPSSNIKFPVIAGMTGMHHNAQLFSIEMESHELFCLGWLGTVILPISVSHIAWDDRYIPPVPAIG
jgi:hypothetical protein